MILLEHREVAGYMLRFEWHGGEYIEVAFKGDKVGFDVINVWDHEADEPRHPRTWEGFIEAVDEYVNDPETDFAHDLPEYAMGRSS